MGVIYSTLPWQPLLNSIGFKSGCHGNMMIIVGAVPREQCFSVACLLNDNRPCDQLTN